MRHGKTINHLSRTKSHRDALLANMAISLIKAKRIQTTLAKAKALRMYIEPLITKGKADNTHSRRTVFSYLQDKEAIKILFGEIAEKVAERNGGYTRIIKLGQRQGDNSHVALIELVDYNVNLLTAVSEDEETKAKKSRRGNSKKSSATTTTAAVVSEPVKEIVSEEEQISPVVETEAVEIKVEAQEAEVPSAVLIEETVAEEVVTENVELVEEVAEATEIAETPETPEITEEGTEEAEK
jgi:large subunit ribosomal protein L17